MKKLKRNIVKSFILLFIVYIFSSKYVYATYDMNDKMYKDHMIFVLDSEEVYHNGESFLSSNKTIIKDGVTYVPLRVVAKGLGLGMQYDNKNKETKVYKGETFLKFYTDKKEYIVNEKKVSSEYRMPYVQDEIIMVPLQIITNNFGIKTVPEIDKKYIHLYWNAKPIAKFSIEQEKIYAKETKVSYVDEYYHYEDIEMINEAWEGREYIFDEPGTYIVTRKVKDANGLWSEPYEVEINVLPENQPPVAKFSTDKDEYLMGENIEYKDESCDDEGIVKTEWTNDERAFFLPGEKTIKLEVVDEHGLKSVYTKEIMIKDSSLYTRDEFNKWFTPFGDKYTLEMKDILSFSRLRYKVYNKDYTLYSSNSPETIKEEGIYYRDIVKDNVRFMIHQQNDREDPVRIYLVASNINDEPLEIKQLHMGIGGPHELTTKTGKIGLSRYLDSLNNTSVSSIIIEPGESKIIFEDISQKRILNGQTLSAYGDLEASLPVQIQTIIIDADKELFESIVSISELSSDGTHQRGTYTYGERVINVRKSIGKYSERIAIGDNTDDKAIYGIDSMTGEKVRNNGNFGVLYKLRLDKVVPQSSILVNARGGFYSGAFLVNDEVVNVTDGSCLLNPDEVAVLYRTGEKEESVNISFIPASGSYLPFNIIIEPLPEKKH